MTTWNRTAGDIADTIVAYLYGVTGTPTASVSHVWQTGAAINLTSATTAGTDPNGAACLIHIIQLGTWLQNIAPTTTRTVYNLEHQVTFSDGRTITWPGDSIIIGKQGA